MSVYYTDRTERELPLQASRVFVTGVPGVGKTTVCKKLVSFASESGTRFEVLNFADIMRSVAGRGQAPSLIHVDADIRATLQTRAVEKIRTVYADSPLVIDGHLVIDTGTAFVPGLPRATWIPFGIKAIVMLIAEPGEVLMRRGEGKRYPAASDARLREHQDRIAAALLEYADAVGATTYRVRNATGELDAAVAEVRELVARHL